MLILHFTTGHFPYHFIADCKGPDIAATLLFSKGHRGQPRLGIQSPWRPGARAVMMRRRTTSQEIQRQLEMEEAQRRLDQERGEEIAIEDGRVEGDLKEPQRAPKGIREEWKPLKIPNLLLPP